jgi:Glycosyltransferase family 87
MTPSISCTAPAVPCALPAPLARRPALARVLPVLAGWLCLAALAGALVTARLGPDASYDLRNYHLYNGFALLQGRVGHDLAPAQLQSFLAPALDLIYALALSALNRHPAALGAVLALPQGLAAFLAWCLSRRLLAEATPARDWLAAAAALLGVTGAGGLSTLGSAMSEMLPACCVLGALLCLTAAPPRPGWAGLLAGLAVGLKLTATPFAAGLAVAALLTGRPGRRRAASLAAFAAAALAGAAVLGGAWWLHLWLRFGDPVFPYFNQIFHSPWTAAVPGTDTRFLPRTARQALAYPLYWAVTPSTLVSELPLRDPRIALGWAAALILALRGLRQRQATQVTVACLAVWTVGYTLWEAQFSILRYLVPLELLSGPFLLAAALRQGGAEARTRGRRSPGPACAPLRSTGWCAAVAAWVVVGAVIAVTVVPDWGRAPPGARSVAVRPPAFAPGSLVVLLDPSPMAYVAAFVPLSVRFVGADNNLVHPGAPGRLARAVAAAIRAQKGPLWGLEAPGESPGAATATLRAYRLVRRPGCVRVRSNLDDNAILACKLRRLRRRPGPPAPRTGPSRPSPSHAA